jgi:hypothetical protein
LVENYFCKIFLFVFPLVSKTFANSHSLHIEPQKTT